MSKVDGRIHGMEGIAGKAIRELGYEPVEKAMQ